jgi:predicted phosphoribosyltransferase
VGIICRDADAIRGANRIERASGQREHDWNVDTGLFPDRRAAGRALARGLGAYADRTDVIILALPRGGVPVGYELARALSAPLDVFLVRKLGVPGHEELGFGALASGGVRTLNDEVVRGLDIDEATIERVTAKEARELERRDRAYRGDRARPQVAGRVVILVDDGLATGSSMRVAIEAIRGQQPDRIVVAVPVAPPEACREIRDQVDEIVCLMTPEPLTAIGLWYEDFTPTSDDEVREILTAGQRQTAPTAR